MSDNIHKSFKKPDTQYYNSGQDWSNYTQPEIKYTQGIVNQEHVQYTQYEPNYVTYRQNHPAQNNESVNYQNRQVEMAYKPMYENYSYPNHNEKLPMVYPNDQQMGYNNNEMAYYNRDMSYYQPRKAVVPNYIKHEYNTQMIHGANAGVKTHSSSTGSMNMHSNPNVNQGMSPSNSNLHTNMSYLQNMGYYSVNPSDAISNSGYKDMKYNAMRPEVKHPPPNQPEMRYAGPGYPKHQNDNVRYGGEDVRFNPSEMYVQQGYNNVDMRYGPLENVRYSQQGYIPNEVYNQADMRGSQIDMAYVHQHYNDGRYMRDLRPEAQEMPYERPYLPSTTMFKPSLSFKEVAAAVLSMDPAMKPPPKKPAARPKSTLKSVAKGSKQSNDVTSAKNSDGSQIVSDSSTKDAKAGRRSNDEESQYYKGETHSTIRTDPDYSKYRNRGLQQLTHYNALAQFHNLPTNYYNNYINQNMGNMVNDIVNNVSNMLGSNVNSVAPPMASVQPAAITGNIPMNIAMRKEWMPIRKINPNVLTPSARFFPPTPKALSNMRNDQLPHKLNVVEEINVENELFKNLKKSTISSACSMMESFQQSLSNKRKRIKNCLVEDCRHVIGEHPRIDVQFSCVEEDGHKKYALDEVLSTLLPYHLFYYDKIKKSKMETFDYSGFSKEILELKQRLNHMTKNKDSILLQSVYPCVKEGLVTCNELVFNVRGDYHY